MIGELSGEPLAILEGATDILRSISPLGTVRLVGRELVFETRRVGAEPWIERIPARDGLTKEEVRHAAIRSRNAAMPKQWHLRVVPPESLG